ncbi:MAG: hypothetical protein ACRC1G_00730 [Bradyrhizobium sp.]|nr:hypothetical protein [Bradyrhizobium sp.]
MSRCKLLVAVGGFLLLTASPALAQHMVDDAGTFPFSMGNPFAAPDTPDPRMKSHAMMRRRPRQPK